jgi:hypothetical protein
VAAEDWLHESEFIDNLPRAASRDWRTVTIAASARLASRLNAALHREKWIGTSTTDTKMIAPQSTTASGLSRRALLRNGAVMAALAALSPVAQTEVFGTAKEDSVTQTSADKNAIRPFHVNVPEAELTELQRRINSTRWPDRETVTDESQGVPLATIQELARYWGTDYDWRKCEAKLNALPQFITEIDGLDIHFIHVRSKHENALPLIVTHGWPGSVIEQ